MMRGLYKLKGTMYLIREDFSKETFKIRKMLWDQVKKFEKTESMQLSNAIR